MLWISYLKEQGTLKEYWSKQERIGSWGNKKKQINQHFNPWNKGLFKSPKMVTSHSMEMGEYHHPWWHTRRSPRQKNHEWLTMRSRANQGMEIPPQQKVSTAWPTDESSVNKPKKILTDPILRKRRYQRIASTTSLSLRQHTKARSSRVLKDLQSSLWWYQIAHPTTSPDVH